MPGKILKKREKIEQIALLLKGALLGEKLVGLKMNVPEEHLEKVVALLPSLNAPTVAPSTSPTGFRWKPWSTANVVRDLIPRLLKTGPKGSSSIP